MSSGEKLIGISKPNAARSSRNYNTKGMTSHSLHRNPESALHTARLVGLRSMRPQRECGGKRFGEEGVEALTSIQWSRTRCDKSRRECMSCVEREGEHEGGCRQNGGRQSQHFLNVKFLVLHDDLMTFEVLALLVIVVFAL